MTELDSRVTSGEMQLMKLLLPYLPPDSRRFLAIWLKFAELRNTLRLFGTRADGSADQQPPKAFSSPADFLKELRPFLDPGSADSLDMICTIMEMLNAMKNSSSGEAPDFGNPEELSELTEMFDTIMKGNENHD